MGGAIASRFTEIYPEKVGKLALISPAGLPVIKPFIANLLFIPVLAEIILYLRARRLITDTVHQEFNAGVEEEKPLLAQILQIKHYQCSYNPNYFPVLLSILRNFPFDNMVSTFAAIGKSEKELLLVMGERDRTIPYRHSEKFKELIPKLEMVSYEDAGHFPYMQKAQDLLEKTVNFFHKK